MDTMKRVDMVDLYGYIDKGRDGGSVWIHCKGRDGGHVWIQ